MNRSVSCIMCLAVLLPVSVAVGQTNNAAVQAAALVSSATSQPAGEGDVVKQTLRAVFAEIVFDEIHNLFTELRLALGLPDGPAGDFLSLLEDAIVERVDAALTE